MNAQRSWPRGAPHASSASVPVGAWRPARFAAPPSRAIAASAGDGPAPLFAAAAAAAFILAMVGAAPAPAETADATLPVPPAFYTQSAGRIRDVQGDSFVFTRDDGKAVRIRLIDADCQPLGDAAIRQAAAVAARLLGEYPFWVFPVGQSKSGEADEVWADVWTDKGWLSQVLIRAGYAQRRTEPSPASLAPPDAAGTSNHGPPPPAPAFLAAGCTPLAGDTLEIEQTGRKLNARLFDVTCQGISSAQRGEANATTSRLFAKGNVWVFPCTPVKADPKSATPVRIWTAEGWLSDALVKAGQAHRGEPPEKADAQPSGQAAAAQPQPAKRPPAEKPAEPTIEWQPVPVTLSQPTGTTGVKVNIPNVKTGTNKEGTPKTFESEIFKIASGLWRVSWESKTPNKNNRVVCQVFRCGGNDPASVSKVPSAHVASFPGATGGQVLRTGPGNYWIRVSGASEATAKVEEAVTKKPAGP